MFLLFFLLGIHQQISREHLLYPHKRCLKSRCRRKNYETFGDLHLDNLRIHHKKVCFVPKWFHLWRFNILHMSSNGGLVNQSSCCFLFMGDWLEPLFGGHRLGSRQREPMVTVSLLNGTNPWDTPKKENHRLKLVQAGMGYMRIWC